MECAGVCLQDGFMCRPRCRRAHGCEDRYVEQLTMPYLQMEEFIRDAFATGYALAAEYVLENGDPPARDRFLADLKEFVDDWRTKL